jgi:hypothetical protein
MAVEKGFAAIDGYVILLGSGFSGFVLQTKPVAIRATSHGGTTLTWGYLDGKPWWVRLAMPSSSLILSFCQVYSWIHNDRRDD